MYESKTKGKQVTKALKRSNKNEKSVIRTYMSLKAKVRACKGS